LKLDDTKKNRKYATQTLIPEITYQLNSGEFFKKSQIPKVSDFARISFKMHEVHRKESTKYDYEASLRLHIIPYFGEHKLDSIKSSDLALWQNKVLERVSARRLKNIRSVFNSILEDAISDGWIDKNPFARVKLPKCAPIDIQPFSMSEIAQILHAAKPSLRAFYAIGFFTGMRVGEIIALKWSDIDFTKREISISKAIRMGRLSSPKTTNSVRTVEIIDVLLPHLKKHYELTGNKESFVFLTGEDTPLFDSKSVRDHDWKRILKELDLKYRTLYQMRHTFTTVMIENGEDILWVSNMLGHKDSTTTLTRYAKYIKREGKQRATFMNAMF